MTKYTPAQLSHQYLTALRRHVRRRSQTVPRSAQHFGRFALTLKWETLDFARMHEQALAALSVDGAPDRNGNFRSKDADAFFLKAVEPIEQTHRAAQESGISVQKLDAALRERLAQIALIQRHLETEITRRKAVEKDLAKGAQHYDLLLAQSRRMHEQMRRLAHQVLSAQEEERKEISRELHDEIAQTLAGINVQLASLQEAAAVNSRGLTGKILATQRLVAESVNVVHRFARDLRPAVLDDLGLIPALRSYLKSMPRRSGLRIHFTAFVGVEAMDSSKRTVLFRVAQEALTNVTRHAAASQVTLDIKKIPGAIQMEVADNGKAFLPDRIFASKTHKRLGLLGMRERVEMVGGKFAIESRPGKGTTVRAEIPFSRKERA